MLRNDVTDYKSNNELKGIFLCNVSYLGTCSVWKTGIRGGKPTPEREPTTE